MLLEDIDQYCPVHKIELIQGQVPILYGLIRYSDLFREQQSKYFPKSKFLVFGGCVTGEEYFHNVKYCQKCREAHRAWAKESGRNDGLAPTEEEDKEYIAYLAKRIDVPDNTLDKVYEFAKVGKVAKAIKLLKEENPDHEFGLLKGFVNMLKQKNDS